MKGTITITRDSEDRIRLRIQDEASCIEFIEALITPATFTRVLTGVGFQEIEFETRGLQFVGKKRVVEMRTAVCPLQSYSREELSEWLKKNAQEDGWTLNAALDTQRSISWENGKTILHYSVVKYVEGTTEKRKTCNRHSDCLKAEEEFFTRTGKKHSPAFHCHDDCCEECFGS